MSRMGELFAQDQLPDVGAPLIPSGGQFSPGLSAVNAMVDQWGRPAPPPDPTVLYNTKAGPITEGDISRATDIAMGFSGGGLSTKPIKAYHSSPHDFDRFDLSKIGTGEGAQVYGHGLYFAESPKVSGQGGEYWNQFRNRFLGPEGGAAETLQAHGFDRDVAIAASQKNIDELRAHLAHADQLQKARGEPDFRHDPNYYRSLLAQREAQHEFLTSGQPVGPRTYDVNIHAKPEQMLDWDKPLNKQAPEVQEILRAKNGPFLDRGEGLNWNVPASQYYKFRTSPGMKSPAELSKSLSEEYDIPGIRYLDQGSRLPKDVQKLVDQYGSREAAAEYLRMQPPSKPFNANAQRYKANMIESLRTPETRNYVIFDPNIIEIMRKYGIVGAAPAGMGALAAQDSYREGM